MSWELAFFRFGSNEKFQHRRDYQHLTSATLTLGKGLSELVLALCWRVDFPFLPLDWMGRKEEWGGGGGGGGDWHSLASSQ